jgi:hypothetical protein
LLRPYKYRLVGDTYIFTTSSKREYSFKFLDITETYRSINPNLQSNVYEFFFFSDKPIKRKDERISKTITLAINRLLTKTDSVVCFTCDNTDKKEDGRKRLFQLWFDGFTRKNIIKIDSSIEMEKLTLHRSIVFLKKNSDGIANIQQTFLMFGHEYFT